MGRKYEASRQGLPEGVRCRRVPGDADRHTVELRDDAGEYHMLGEVERLHVGGSRPVWYAHALRGPGRGCSSRRSAAQWMVRTFIERGGTFRWVYGEAGALGPQDPESPWSEQRGGLVEKAYRRGVAQGLEAARRVLGRDGAAGGTLDRLVDEAQAMRTEATEIPWLMHELIDRVVGIRDGSPGGTPIGCGSEGA